MKHERTFRGKLTENLLQLNVAVFGNFLLSIMFSCELNLNVAASFKVKHNHKDGTSSDRLHVDHVWMSGTWEQFL